MAPTTTPPDPESAVTRARVRTRREPAPLDQLPAWRDLVPVMDPALTTEPEPGLEALLGGLNADQRRAVTHEAGPLLVVAGAGTGKTQVITRRIAWLIATRRARPSEILALTFTDKAAEEMAVRVDQLVPYGYTDTAISTFHAFGDGIIREYALELGLPDRPAGADPARGRDLPARAPVRIRARSAIGRSATRPASSTRWRHCSAGARTRTSRPRPIGTTHGRSPPRPRRSTGWSPAPTPPPKRTPTRRPLDVRRPRGRTSSPAPTRPIRNCSPPTAASTSATRCRSRCGSSGARPRRAPRSPAGSATSSSMSSRTRTAPQAELVALLAESHRNITVVGDDDQAIYAFRGAAIDNILDFRDRYPGLGRSSCAGTTARTPRSSTPPTD